jgi:FAD:protein FMN transferase
MRVIKFQRNFMNTTITIQVIADENDPTVEVQNAIELAFGEFDRIVKTYTRFNETSELAKLNQQGGKWVEVSQEFLHLIKFMLQLARTTNGAFDPTIIDLLEAYGYSAKYDFAEKLADPELAQKIQSLIATRPSWDDIELDEVNLKVKLAPKQRLDLGSVGKGYAIDCAWERLKNHANFLIDAGGDIRVQGSNLEGNPWQLGLKHKQGDQEGYLGKVELASGSLCSSGSWARKIGQFHHIINPTTGKPENNVATTYTYAPTAFAADGWSTPLFLTADLNILPKEVAGVIITSEQKLAKSENFPEVLPF